MTTAPGQTLPTVIIGGGFTGLSAAWELASRGLPVTVLEADPSPGGLAGGFTVGGHLLERFYHHWFTSDTHVMALIRDLGLEDNIVHRPTRTGMYFANTMFRLSKPVDVLRFTPLSLINRIRLGLLVFQARAVKDWMALENESAKDWLIRLCGREVYRVVWEPLLVGKFGPFAETVSAVWFWNKLALRGGSRGKGGGEVLAYYRKGFAALADSLAEAIRAKGGQVLTGTPATGLVVADGRVTAVETPAGPIAAGTVLATQALPLVADLAAPHVGRDYADRLRRIQWLANVCLVLELDRSLSETYWLNVNDADFPFVGIIEHTNFEPPATYGGRHIVYLSKYLPETAALYTMDDGQVLDFALPHIQRMFPAFRRDWVKGHHVWRARFAQPVVEKHYSTLIPDRQTPLDNLFLCSMAQIYPEDRGTNYAVREGRAVGRWLAERVKG